MLAEQKARADLEQLNRDLEERIKERTAQLTRVNEELSEANRAKDVFLATLSRYPTLQEKTTAAKWLDADRTSASDLQWVLLNKVDFVFNY